jgi:hypothetical protein
MRGSAPVMADIGNRTFLGGALLMGAGLAGIVGAAWLARGRPRSVQRGASDSIEPDPMPGTAKDILVAGVTGPGPSG